jgi:hypothetical protein
VFQGLLPVAVAGVEVEDEHLLVGGEVAALHVRPEVVQPAQPAALARPLQPCLLLPPTSSSVNTVGLLTHTS